MPLPANTGLVPSLAAAINGLGFVNTTVITPRSISVKLSVVVAAVRLKLSLVSLCLIKNT